MDKLNLDENNLKKFGITMGIIFLAITILFFLRHNHNSAILFVISMLFFASGIFIPGSLGLFYMLWMKLAFILGWFNTRLILIVFFYLVFTAMGLIMKIFRIDLLDARIEKDKQTYWRKKDKQGFCLSNYERQF